MTVAEQLLCFEKQRLSPYAFFSGDTRGRSHESSSCELRLPFQRDRDKILHSSAFRRLKHKTQVFLAPTGDHYRTRLTHTLEVSQIARTVARALFLNEDLVEAICLGHDLGHTPFGHAGERALGSVSPFGFFHYLQSVRVAERIEKLNLTYEVKNGIACHTKGPEAETLEGRLVKLADKIAYINHDIEDAVSAGILSESDIPKAASDVLGTSKNARITSIVCSVVRTTKDTIAMEPDTDKAFWLLHEFMFDAVYTNPKAKSEEKKAEELLCVLYEYFVKNKDKLPEEYQKLAEEDGTEHVVCDYISGMTDRFAVSTYSELFIPKSWQK